MPYCCSSFTSVIAFDGTLVSFLSMGTLLLVIHLGKSDNAFFSSFWSPLLSLWTLFIISSGGINCNCCCSHQITSRQAKSAKKAHNNVWIRNKVVQLQDKKNSMLQLIRCYLNVAASGGAALCCNLSFAFAWISNCDNITSSTLCCLTVNSSHVDQPPELSQHSNLAAS